MGPDDLLARLGTKVAADDGAVFVDRAGPAVGAAPGPHPNYRRALALCPNQIERAHLKARLAALGSAGPPFGATRSVAP